MGMLKTSNKEIGKDTRRLVDSLQARAAAQNSVVIPGETEKRRNRQDNRPSYARRCSTTNNGE